MNCVRSFTDLKQQGQLHYEPACQEDIKVGRYKGRQVPEFRVSLGHREFRPRSRPRPRPKCGRNGNFRAESYPNILLSMLYKGWQISELFCNVKKKCACCLFLRIKGQGSWDADSWDNQKRAWGKD